MIYELSKSIMDRFNSADGASIRGDVQGLWEDLAPSDIVLATQTGEELQQSVKPFIVYTFITTSLEQNFCADMYSPIVQFTIFGDGNNKSSISLTQIGVKLLNLYVGKVYSMDNDYTMIRNNVIDQSKFLDDDKMWNVIYQFEYMVQKDITREET